MGCVNFKNAEDVDLPVVRQLLAECAKVDLVGLMEKYLKAKKK